ncbi:MAG: cysteine desulfurase [Bacteroidetes bacterium]|nr:cysteine desulfurase [Bacteroidota bacterium]
MERIYFDNAATTPVAPEVVEAMLPYIQYQFGNASSVHHFGKGVKVILEDTRDLVADFLKCKPKEVFFTSGGTESDNFAIKGPTFHFLNSGKNHIITTSIEHSALNESVKYLNERFGTEITYIKPERDGSIDPQKILAAVTPKTHLISMMHANNELGVVNDIKTIADNTDRNEIIFHADTVQSIGKTAFNTKDFNVNIACMSGHKIYGPKGIGVMYIKDGTPIDKLIHGGKQERNMRGGTENIAGVVGLKRALEILIDRMDEDLRHYKQLKGYFKAKLQEYYPEGIIINGDSAHTLDNIINISFDQNYFDVDSETLLINLDLKGTACSSGSACTSGSPQPSRILMELGLDYQTALCSVRVSFGRDNTTEEVDKFFDIVRGIAKKRSIN